MLHSSPAQQVTTFLRPDRLVIIYIKYYSTMFSIIFRLNMWKLPHTSLLALMFLNHNIGSTVCRPTAFLRVGGSVAPPCSLQVVDGV